MARWACWARQKRAEDHRLRRDDEEIDCSTL
jgi:hypothetical protein